jgi:hypothetical protein
MDSGSRAGSRDSRRDPRAGGDLAGPCALGLVHGAISGVQQASRAHAYNRSTRTGIADITDPASTAALNRALKDLATRSGLAA